MDVLFRKWCMPELVNRPFSTFMLAYVIQMPGERILQPHGTSLARLPCFTFANLWRNPTVGGQNPFRTTHETMVETIVRRYVQ